MTAETIHFAKLGQTTYQAYGYSWIEDSDQLPDDVREVRKERVGP